MNGSTVLYNIWTKIYFSICAFIGLGHNNISLESIRQELAHEEQVLIEQFCTLRGMDTRQFMEAADIARQHICSNNALAKNLLQFEDTLSESQKDEIKEIFREANLEVNTILQFKHEYDDGTASIFISSCFNCPLIVISKRFWSCSKAYRRVAIRHELVHLLHEDSVTRSLMEGYWNYVAQERSEDQKLFENIYYAFLKFLEKRADIEALLLSNLSDAKEYVEVFKRDASWDTAGYIIKQVLKSKDLTAQEREHFNTSLQYLKKGIKINAFETECVQNCVNEISAQKERFTFLQNPVSSQSPYYLKRRDYPCALERLEYCSRVLNLLEKAKH